MTSITTQKVSAFLQNLAQYLSEMINSSSLTQANRLILYLLRKQNTTNQSKSMELPTIPDTISCSLLTLSSYIQLMSAFIYSQGTTLPASFSLDMFSRKASRVGVRAHGFSMFFLGLQTQCAVYFYLSLSLSMMCPYSCALTMLREVASMVSNECFYCPETKMLATLVCSSLSSTCVAVVVLVLRAIALIISLIVDSVLVVFLCSFSMLLITTLKLSKLEYILLLFSFVSLSLVSSTSVRYFRMRFMSDLTMLYTSDISLLADSTSLLAASSSARQICLKCYRLSMRSLSFCTYFSAALLRLSRWATWAYFCSTILSPLRISFIIICLMLSRMSCQLASNCVASWDLYRRRLLRFQANWLWMGSRLWMMRKMSSGVVSGNSFTQREQLGMDLTGAGRGLDRNCDFLVGELDHYRYQRIQSKQGLQQGLRAQGQMGPWLG